MAVADKKELVHITLKSLYNTKKLWWFVLIYKNTNNTKQCLQTNWVSVYLKLGYNFGTVDKVGTFAIPQIKALNIRSKNALWIF